jgi:hypothetical protein
MAFVTVPLVLSLLVLLELLASSASFTALSAASTTWGLPPESLMAFVTALLVLLELLAPEELLEELLALLEEPELLELLAWLLELDGAAVVFFRSRSVAAAFNVAMASSSFPVSGDGTKPPGGFCCWRGFGCWASA